MPGSIQLFQKYLSDVFIETGSYEGDGIAQALDAGFKEVRSIEIADYRYTHCQTRFANDSRVKMYQGDSGQCLKDVIADLKKPATFWLDGHFNDTPLIAELNQIANHDVKCHTILIDDWRLYASMESEIRERLEKIIPGFVVVLETGVSEYPNDVFAAFRK